MEIGHQFQVLHHVDSFMEYRIPKQYHSTSKITLKSPTPMRKRETYINQVQKLSKQSPGPGKYNINPQPKEPISKKYNRKIDFNKLQKQAIHNGKHTFLDEELKRTKKIPQPGRYNPEVDHAEEIREKYEKGGDSERKIIDSFRPTFADAFNSDMQKVAPGHYEVLKPMGYKSQSGSFLPEHKAQRTESLPKLPSSFDYNPIPVSFETFSRKKLIGKSRKNSVDLLKPKSERKYETLGPGPKYSLIVDWGALKGKSGQNYWNQVSTGKQPGVYF